MKRRISILLICTLLLSFVPQSLVYASAVTDNDIMPLLSELDIMKGDPNGNLRLDDYVSRAEFTKVAVAASSYRNMVSKTLAISPFRDVLSTHWAAPYIEAAVSNGICTGYPDGKFKPDITVSYEEAVTMFLKLLGYTDQDFGISWPYGQIGIAEKIGLCDGITKNVGEALTRRDVSKLCYNLLNTNSKNSSVDYITTLDYKIIEDVILVATSKEDSSVGSGKINTSAGLFKIDGKFDDNNVGKKGDIVVKNTDEMVSFIPDEQTVKRYNIYQVLDSDIVVMENGKMESLDIDKNLSVYNKSNKMTFSSMLSGVSAGDVLVTYSNSNGVLDYGMIKTDELEGPYTYTDASFLSSLGLSSAVVTRDGSPSTIASLQKNDIMYYSVPLNTVWSYSSKVTGVYEKALPNKDTPTSVQISGKTYKIESATAFNKLSSSGSFEYGDTITVMLGKSNEIADVMAPSTQGTVYGYLVETGTKELIASDTSKYVNNYVKLALPDGNVYEYTVDMDYKDYVNKIVKLIFHAGTATVSVVNNQSAVSGTVNWSSKTLGNYILAADVNILDVYSSSISKVSKYASVYPQRIDGVNLSAANILFVNTNTKNEITDIILNNVTGDIYSYGVVKDVNDLSGKAFVAGSYTYMIDGVEKTVTTSGKAYNITSGDPSKFMFTPSGAIDSIQALTKLDGTVSDVTESYITINSMKYLLSDKVSVYKKDKNFDYTMIPISQIMNSSAYTLTPYYDKSQSSGGRIRIIIAEEKKK